MPAALYKVGDKAFHKALRKWGRVVCCFEEIQGKYRYYIRHGELNWSVPEWGLDSTETAHEQNRVVVPVNFRKKPPGEFPPAG